MLITVRSCVRDSYRPDFTFIWINFSFSVVCAYSLNKRLSQQPALGALTFLRSFVAGKENFCSHPLASAVHFTVVKSQAILLIRLGVAEVIYHSFLGSEKLVSAVTLYLLPDSKRRNFYLVGYFQAQQFCVWTLLIDRRFDSNDVSVKCKWRGRINKKRKSQKTSIANLS